MSSVDLRNEKSTVIKLMFRSVSVNDLEAVVKELIEEALNNNEETMELQMMVCGEDYFRKFPKINQETKKIDQLLDTSNYEKRKPEEKKLGKCAVTTVNSPHQEKQFTKEQPDKTLDRFPTFLNVMQDSKTSKTSKAEEKIIIKKCCKTEKTNECEKLKLNKNYPRPNLTKNQEKIDKKAEEKSQETIKSKGNFSFEAWKEAKNRIYKTLLREEGKKRQQALAENAKKLEKERSSRIVYLNWKKDQQNQQKLKRMCVKVAKETMMPLKIKSNEKLYANLQAFKKWKNQKEAKIRKEKIAQRWFNLQSGQTPQAETNPFVTIREVNINFDTWLNQLNNVLHQKYLRERRFQVKSFYCQPIYY